MATLIMTAVYYFLHFLILLIIVNALISWLPINRQGAIVKLIHNLLEPLLSPIRKMIHKSIFGSTGMVLDFSPFIAYLVLTTLRTYISYYLGSF